MIRLSIDNRNIYIHGASPAVMRHLESVTSYRVEGAHWSPAFRSKRWDGKEHLLMYSERAQAYFAPAGLSVDIARELKSNGIPYKVDMGRRPRHPFQELPWTDEKELRDYQVAAGDSLFSGNMPGLGLLIMPIRSGKTLTAGDIFRRVGRPGVFIVTSQLLLEQGYQALCSALPGVDIGMIGDGVYREGFITVATIQTLFRMRGKRADPGKRNGRAMDPRYKAMCLDRDIIITDEVHHFRGTGDWYKVPYEFNSCFKVALSATAYLEDKTEQDRGVIWLKAIFGQPRIRISMSELIEKGYLMKQHVRMFTIREPDMLRYGWSETLREKCITRNKVRNGLIARLVSHAVMVLGMKTVVISNRYDHTDAIAEELSAMGIPFAAITGKNTKRQKREIMEWFTQAPRAALVGTVLGEGLDMPVVQCVVNAEGGKDAKATVQRQRNLTMVEGKESAVFVDFYDETNSYFQEHSQMRLDAYREESAFDVQVIESIESGVGEKALSLGLPGR